MFPSNLTNLQNVILEDTSSFFRGGSHIEDLYQSTHTLTSLSILQACIVITPTIFDPQVRETATSDFGFARLHSESVGLDNRTDSTI
ncbi:hypothetical protein JAAARDRAFT_33453 [Jaapia argillacea MUCL 33604]|uniref:Uncharacterized protein n=1 Tax=Jaapia argillacea MUCL 33604 TaxID=933084 RepID=A0A067QBD0_9AGAM|nr:hypothetical protein JAAARDRAFT_33453 [Jaapia argillacea MUCL 33604]